MTFYIMIFILYTLKIPCSFVYRKHCLYVYSTYVYIIYIYIYILHTEKYSSCTRFLRAGALRAACVLGKWTKTILLSRWNSCPLDSPTVTSSATATRKTPSCWTKSPRDLKHQGISELDNAKMAVP